MKGDSNMKKAAAVFSAVALAATASVSLAACSKGVSASDDKTVCFVHSTRGYLDKTVGKQLGKNLVSFGKKQQLKVSALAKLDDALKGNCQTIVTYGRSLAAPAIKAAQTNTSLNFVIDDAVEDQVGVIKREKDSQLVEGLPSNVHPYTIDISQGTELAGYVAAGMTQSGYLGAVISDPSVPDLAQAFEAGAERYNLAHGTGIQVLNTATEGIAKGVVPEKKVESQVKKLLDNKADMFLVALDTKAAPSPSQGKKDEGAAKPTDASKNSAAAQTKPTPGSDASAKDVSFDSDLTPFFTALGDAKPGFIAIGTDAAAANPDHKAQAATTIAINTKPIATELIDSIAKNTFRPVTRGDLRNGTIDLGPFNDYSAWLTLAFKKEINDMRLQLTGGAKSAVKVINEGDQPKKPGNKGAGGKDGKDSKKGQGAQKGKDAKDATGGQDAKDTKDSEETQQPTETPDSK